jgi:hypothetical protein
MLKNTYKLGPKESLLEAIIWGEWGLGVKGLRYIQIGLIAGISNSTNKFDYWIELHLIVSSG